MDKLKELVASKRKAAEEEFKGKKYVKRGELEELRLAKLRAEETAEKDAKVPCCLPGRFGGAVMMVASCCGLIEELRLAKLWAEEAAEKDARVLLGRCAACFLRGCVAGWKLSWQCAGVDYCLHRSCASGCDGFPLALHSPSSTNPFPLSPHLNTPTTGGQAPRRR